MAARRSGRTRALVPASTSPERLAVIQGYCGPKLAIDSVPFNRGTGLVDVAALRGLLGDDVACVYLENPNFLGAIEADAPAIAEAAHAAGAYLAVGVDPLSLGVLAAPPRYGADLVCGELQPLGVHQHFGGGLAGFIATPDEEEWIAEYPTFLLGLAATDVPGEYGFGEVAWERISYVQRGEAHEYTGTTQNLWAIAAAVYLSLLGPQGLAELGEGLMQRAAYAAARFAEVPGVTVPLDSTPFKEIVVSLEGTGRRVREVEQALRAQGIFPGVDITEHAGLGPALLVCTTEVHTRADIDRLVDAVAEVVA
jgi:glycine dehydrogenase subunit 1